MTVRIIMPIGTVVDFSLTDTGGIEMGSDDAFQSSITSQALAATDEADVIVFLVDGQTGINADDEEVARILRRSKKPVLLAVNKLDSIKQEGEIWEFYQLGLGDPPSCFGLAWHWYGRFA